MIEPIGMDNLLVLQDYFNVQAFNTNIWAFVGDIVLTALLALILTGIYINFGNTLSNRSSFANNFVLLSLTTMLIITIVKSSLALSLGLVGALSIVRFRAAIKDPEELTYLFLAISIGLGFGANQRYLTIIAFTAIVLIIVVKSLLTKKSVLKNNLYISLSSKKEISVKGVLAALKEYTTYASLKRLEKTEDKSELLFLVNFGSVEDLEGFKERIKKQDGHLEVTFFEDKGVFN